MIHSTGFHPSVTPACGERESYVYTQIPATSYRNDKGMRLFEYRLK
jgi:hypothetical protein